jgi:hypothetical protein
VRHKSRSWPPSCAPCRLLKPPPELYARAHRPPTDAARLPHHHGRLLRHHKLSLELTKPLPDPQRASTRRR